MKVTAPFNHQIPKDLRGNLEWRAAVHERVMREPEYIDVIREACAVDPLFYLNGFTYTFDPRLEPFTRIPFILYPYQEQAILDLIRAISNNDILLEKSRDMGASWLCVSAFEWCWHWREGLSFLMVSRVEDYVDQAGNPKALFWKFDYLLDYQPAWLRPIGYDRARHRRKMHAENPATGSVVDGESTTGRVARGDRRTAILLDEFAAVEQGHGVLKATRDATKCRIFNSTPDGTNNAFYDMRETNIRKLRLHWTEHPVKAAGLYTTDDDGNLKVLDPDGYPEGYEPILDGKLRSPWYDEECERCVSSQEVAQELDIDYLGSGYQYFRSETIQERIRQYARPPVVIGDLEYDADTAEPIRFVENPNGHIQLWCLLGRENKPSAIHKISMGGDISAGTGASNSCLAAYDIVTNEKVLEYVNPYIRPEELAKVAVAIARWLGNAFLIWESNGPGRQFGSRVVELGYGHIFYRQREEAISKNVSDIPGWASTKETKLVLMGAYRAALEKGDCVNRSKEALDETLEYIFTPDSSIEHSRATRKVDPSGAKSNHGDRVMADALAWRGIAERARRRPVAEAPEIPVGSLAWRNKMRE